MDMNTSDSTVERGSGNVFADLDVPDADAHLLKAELVSRIDTIVRQRRITQIEAARRLSACPSPTSRGSFAATFASIRSSACFAS